MRNKKTLILSDGEYKKFNEGKHPVEPINIIPVMTSNTEPYGVADSSSIYATSYPAWKAFNNKLEEKDNGWMSNTTGRGWISYEFTSSIIISGYSLAPRNHSYGLENAPKDWTFEGWNGTSWIVLDSQINITNWEYNKRKTFMFFNQQSFLKYRVNVTQNINSWRVVAIGALEMFQGFIELSRWQTISPTLPTSQQFQEEGMEDLSILDRKVQPVLDSPISMSSEVLSEGKVFKGKVGLKKIIDLRKLKVK